MVPHSLHSSYQSPNTDRAPVHDFGDVFTMKGDLIVRLPLDVVKIAVPPGRLLPHHVSGELLDGEAARRGLCAVNGFLPFTAAGNNFEAGDCGLRGCLSG